MRRSFDGLALAVQERMQRDPHSGALYVFVNANRTRIKILWFEASGYSLLYKRLDRGVFRVPDPSTAHATGCDIDANELFAILDGIELPTDRKSARKIVHQARTQALHAREKIQHSRTP